ncbi:HD-GYP domain-containing protein [Geobacter sp. DSM 9736]|uniref:HD-GYP domain-containing protein n=1 Tax=Geobacter sp. DSM 9736 TaxID=1277350 RepID=UPI000B509873|nr:HD domain-containing protein [Geobacter sp. DSM 9736]SNB45445.1 HD domain-containing protein [Geobacter sp. DSM 9736]
MHMIAENALNIALEHNSLVLVQKCLYARNLDLYRHSVLTAEIAWEIVVGTKKDFGLSATQAYLAGMLHDVGKLFIQDRILDKRHSLTEREWEVMEKHPVWGHEYVQGTIFQSLGDIILHHHRLPDGSGYPIGLPPEALDDRVRLIGSADKIAAFLEDRPYRRRISNFDLISQEVKAVVEMYFQGEKAEAVIAAVLEAVSREHSTIVNTEKLDRMVGGCR